MILILMGIIVAGGCVQGDMDRGMMQGGQGGMMGGQGMMEGQDGMMNGMMNEMMNEMMKRQDNKTNFSSNGERIYHTATSDSGKPITFTMDGMEMGDGMNMGGGMMGAAKTMMSCVSCHGEDGRGGAMQMMMMGTIEVPDIRYSSLTTGENAHGETDGEKHIPYTDETIKDAITRGIKPDGDSLEMHMPRWNMSEEDLDDLIEYLKTLG